MIVPHRASSSRPQVHGSGSRWVSVDLTLLRPLVCVSNPFNPLHAVHRYYSRSSIPASLPNPSFSPHMAVAADIISIFPMLCGTRPGQRASAFLSCSAFRLYLRHAHGNGRISCSDNISLIYYAYLGVRRTHGLGSCGSTKGRVCCVSQAVKTYQAGSRDCTRTSLAGGCGTLNGSFISCHTLTPCRQQR